jgi:hypothetical protein
MAVLQVELNRLVAAEGLSGRIVAKLENLNPGYSKKDRVARQIIEEVGSEFEHLGLPSHNSGFSLFHSQPHVARLLRHSHPRKGALHAWILRILQFLSVFLGIHLSENTTRPLHPAAATRTGTWPKIDSSPTPPPCLDPIPADSTYRPPPLRQRESHSPYIRVPLTDVGEWARSVLELFECLIYYFTFFQIVRSFFRSFNVVAGACRRIGLRGWHGGRAHVWEHGHWVGHRLRHPRPEICGDHV